MNERSLQTIIDRWSVGETDWCHADVTTLLAEVNRLRDDNQRLARISLAARRLDNSIAEFGLKNPAYIADIWQSLHDLLHRSPDSATTKDQP